MRRLEETLRQMVQAGKAIGNTELENKFNEGRLHNISISVLFYVLLHSNTHTCNIYYINK